MKRFLYFAPLFLLLFIAGGVFGVSRIDTEVMRERLAEAVRDSTGKPLLMETAPEISFFPPGLTFGPARWGMAADKPATEGLSVSVKSGSIHLAFLPLLTGRIVIDAIRLDSPVVTIRPMRKGAPPLAAPHQDAASTGAPTSDTSPTLSSVELARLSIVNGVLDVETDNGSMLQAEGFNVSITNFRPDAEAAVKLDMSLRVSDPDLAGNLALAMKARLRDSRVVLRQASLTVTPLRGPLPPAAGPVQLLLDGAYDMTTGQGDLSALTLTCNGFKAAFSGTGYPAAGSLQGTLHGEIALRALAKIFSVALPLYPVKDTLTLESRLSLENGRLRLTALKGVLNDTSVRGDLSLRWRDAPAIRGSLETGDISSDAWLKTTSEAAEAEPVGAAGRPGSTDSNATPAVPHATGTPTVHAISGTSKTKPVFPAVDLHLKVASVTVTSLRCMDLRTHLVGEGGRYAMDPLTFSLNTGGSVAVVLTADLTAHRYTVSGKAADVAAGPLSQALKGTRPLDAAAFLETRLSWAGEDVRTMKGSLSGTGRLSLRNIILNGFSVLPRNVSGLFTGTATGTHFDALQAPFTVKSGIMSISPLTLRAPALTAKGQATIDLPRESLNCAADIHLPGMTVPVVVSGPFSHLSYGLNPRKTRETLIKIPGGVLPPGQNSGNSNSRDPVRALGGVVRGLFGF